MPVQFRFVNPLALPPEFRTYMRLLLDEIARTANQVNTALLLDDLADVVITAAANGDTLRFDGTNWVNSGFLANFGSSVSIGSGASKVTFTTPSAFEFLETLGVGVDRVLKADFANGVEWRLVDLTNSTQLFFNGLTLSPGQDAVIALGDATTRWTDGFFAGDLMVQGLAYAWPVAQGEGLLANDGAGALSWGGGLDNLSDVTLDNPTAGDLLRFDGTGWTNRGEAWLQEDRSYWGQEGSANYGPCDGAAHYANFGCEPAASPAR